MVLHQTLELKGDLASIPISKTSSVDKLKFSFVQGSFTGETNYSLRAACMASIRRLRGDECNAIFGGMQDNDLQGCPYLHSLPIPSKNLGIEDGGYFAGMLENQTQVRIVEKQTHSSTE